MRDDIYTEVNGVKTIDLIKCIGRGYGNGWFTNCNCRYRWFVGARSTKKSVDIIGYESIIKILSDERRNILVVRQNDSDNRQSAYENILGRIYDLGLEDRFSCTKNPLMIEYKPTGQRIIFRGMNNPTSLNSITFAVGYFTDVYLEEAFEMQSYEDFRKLDGSLRGKLPKGLFHQITGCMNAWNKDCWIYEEFFRGNLEDDFEKLDDPDTTFMDYHNPDWIGNYGKGLYLHKSTYKINEFRDKEVYDVAMNEMKRKSLEIYKVEALGMWGNATGATYPEFNKTCIKPIQELLKYKFVDFAIGIDTGLSSGDGKKKKVLKGQDVETRIKSATTMSLVAINHDYKKIVTLEEYFHSNDKAYNRVNTDNRDNLTSPQLMDQCIKYIISWIRKYSSRTEDFLMKGRIKIYVDCADIGFRQGLELKATEYGLFNLEFSGSTKISIQSRIDFIRLMMAYGDYVVAETCPNIIREMKNSKKGENGEPRENNDDHEINANEYAWCPFRGSLLRWKTFKEH